MSKARRRIFLGLTAALALLAGWWMARRPAGEDRPLASPAARSEPRPLFSFRGGPGAAEPGETTRQPAPPAARPPGAPVIDEVRVEKPEVCEGEENLVTVKAHAPDRADDPHLHYLIAGESGSRVVVRGNPDPRVRALAKVVVFGRDQTSTTADVPAFVVKECKVEHRLVIVRRTLPNRDAEFELTARLDPIAAREPFRPVRYEWRFGDGASTETTGPVATHDYSRRPQDRLRAEFLVAVAAIAQSGARVEGRTTIDLLNPSFESLAWKGIVKIYADLEPRFPLPTAGGAASQRVRLWHPYSSPVKIQHVRRLRLGPGVSPGAAEELSGSALGIARIAPGETVEVSGAALDPAPDPRVTSTEYYVEGTTDDGFRAVGNFALMRPPRLPTREDHLAVQSPLLRAKILRARALLGQAYVTDEDIWRLEREGRMKDLVVEAPSAAPDPGAQPKPFRPETPDDRPPPGPKK
jgi:hypothetical protein